MTEESMHSGDVAPEGTPGTGQNICPECNGTGAVDGTACPSCDGLGTVVEAIGGA
jgi:DnaJ-class molecular chaperone